MTLATRTLKLRVATAAVAIAALGAIAAATAGAATYTFDGGTGTCTIPPAVNRTVIARTLTAPAVTTANRWNVPIMVHTYVRLVDLGGNRLSDWAYAGGVTLQPGARTTFGGAQLSTGSANGVRIQRDVAYYWNSASPFEEDVATISSYSTSMSILIGYAYVPTHVNSSDRC